MSAYIAFKWPRLRSPSTGQQRSPEPESEPEPDPDHRARQRSRSELAPPQPPSLSHDAVPSPPADVADVPATHSTSPETKSEATLEAHLIPLPESPPRCASAVSAMDPTHETIDNSPAVTSVVPLSSSLADQVHFTETDATLPSEDRPAHSPTYSKEKNGVDNQTDVLQKLATDRMAAMALRSDAQEQGKALRRLYDQSFDDISSVVAVLKEYTLRQASAEPVPTPLGDQVKAISSLLSSVEKARKAFHKSQERLLDVEWSMMERENKLYAQYGGKTSLPGSVNALSDSLSDLPSILPASSDEDQYGLPFPEQDIASVQDGIPILEGLEGDIGSKLRDAYMETGIYSSATLGNEHTQPSQTLLDGRLEGKSPNLDRTDMEGISLLLKSDLGQSVQALTAPGRIFSYSQTPVIDMRLSCLGSQFPKNSNDEERVSTTKHVPTTAYTVSGLSRWLAYGVPWSSLTTGYQHRPYRLPGGVSTLQGITISNYESVALGLPMSRQLDLLKDLTRDLADEEVRARRGLLLHNWLWEPNAPCSYASNMVPTISRPDPQMQRSQFNRSMRTASEESPDFGEVKAIHSDLPIIALNTSTIRSNPAVPQNPSRAESLP